MTLEEFQDLLERRGTDPGAWSVGQRRRARRLLERSAEARRRHAQAERLADELAELREPAPPELRARLWDIPARHPRAAVSHGRHTVPTVAMGWLGAGAAAGLACFLAGMALGALWLDRPEDVDLATVVYSEIVSEEEWL